MINTFIPLIIFLFPLAYSPGPGNMFFAANGARFGYRATLRASAGYHFATWLITTIIGMGLAFSMGEFPQAFILLKIMGSLYIFFLAWKMYNSGALKHQNNAQPAGFIDGVMLLILNPKAYVIIALMYAQFLPLSEASNINLIFWIATIFTLNNLIAFTLWTVLGDVISSQFRNTTSTRRINILFSLILAGVALWMLIS